MTYNSKIFLDGGDPAETREILALLGSLEGQTTNPTLIAKNPYAKARFEKGEKFTKQEILDFYKSVVTNISSLIPNGSVSIEVYADKNTTAEEMLKQAREMWKWIPNAHIKFPTTHVGLASAEQLISEGGRVNMTLVFSQEQAAAVHSATRGAKKGDVFVSPFVGRLDDIGQNGMDLIKNIKQMYNEAESHVEILSASIRSNEHFLASLAYKADIITAPAKAIYEWVSSLPLPLFKGEVPSPRGEGVSPEWIQGWLSDSKNFEGFQYDAKALKPIPYKQLDLSKNWRDFDIAHPLTDKGVERFANDWNALIK